MSHITGPELSPQELKVLKYIVKGDSSSEIGKRLELSVRTVESYRQNIKRKTYTKNVAQLIIYAIKHDLVNI